MKHEEFEYVVLDGKAPIHKFKNGGWSWEQAKDYRDIAVIIKEPYVVFDFDTKSDAALAWKIVQAENLKCSVLKTDRGIHVWFTSPVAYKNHVKQKLTAGIYADIRSYGRAGYTKIKKDGVYREWLLECWNDMQEIPPFFRAVKNTSYQLKGMGDGDGRNNTLYNYVLSLQQQGFTRDEVKETIRIVNQYVFDKPLSARELKTVVRDEAFKTDEEIAKLKEEQQEEKGEKPKFQHNLFGDVLIENNHVVTVNDVIYSYRDGYYKPSVTALKKEMNARMPNIRKNQRMEVLEYIAIQTSLEQEQIKVEPYTVNLLNGRLNIRTGKLTEHTPDVIEFCRVPIIYDKDATCADVDKLVDNVFLQDVECIKLFWEMMGDCLIKKNLYQKAFLLVGEGSNGKSTIINMIREFIGYQNCSTVGLEELAKYKIAELENKLVNIGDDVENKPIRNSGTLKKLFSGEPFTTEKKFKDPFTLVSYATQIFTCNQIPSNSDKTNGMYRRWMILPFEARFDKDTEGYDPLILEKVTTDMAKSYILNKAIEGFKRLYKRGHYVEPARARLCKERYAIDNSSVLTWIEEEQITVEVLTKENRLAIYNLYLNWCKANGLKEPVKSVTFYREIIRKFGVDMKRLRRDGNLDYYFVVRIDF